MADSKISDLTEDTAPDADADYFVTVDDSAGANKRVNFRNTLKNAFRGALVRKVSDQNTANYTTAAAVAWDQEAYDVGGWHDNVTNNSRLTVPAGVTRVRLTANIRITNSTADVFALIQLFKNGSAAFDGAANQFNEVGASTAMLNIASAVLEVTAGDYFEIFLTIETDTSVSLIADRCNFSIEAVT